MIISMSKLILSLRKRIAAITDLQSHYLVSSLMIVILIRYLQQQYAKFYIIISPLSQFHKAKVLFHATEFLHSNFEHLWYSFGSSNHRIEQITDLQESILFCNFSTILYVCPILILIYIYI